MLVYETHWPAALFIYCIVVFIFAFALRSLLVYRRSGVNPLVLPSSDDAYGYVALAFKVVIASIGVVIIGLAIWPDSQIYFGRWTALSSPALAYVGWALLIASLIWLLIAQAQMGASWRIGIDAKRRTELVQHGLFTVSRNPIFLAMRVHLIGLFLIFPSAVTAALLVAGEVLIQVQVRLEEQHLANLHGQVYDVLSGESPPLAVAQRSAMRGLDALRCHARLATPADRRRCELSVTSYLAPQPIDERLHRVTPAPQVCAR